MKLEGSLDAFSLPDVFQLLSLTKKSGGLHLANGQVTGAVYFTDGAVTGAVSDEARQGLARRLVGMAVVDDAALRRAVDRAAAESVGVARAILESGSADAQTVQSLAREHTVDAVFDLLRWPNGDFSFTVDEANPDDVGISAPSDEIVTEANVRRETWEGVSKVIPSPDVVLTMAVVLDGSPEISAEEWALLALVDGSRSVGELVELSGAGQFGVVSALAALVQRSLLNLRDEDSADHVTVVRRRQALLAGLEGGYSQPDQIVAPDQAGTSIVAPLVADPSAYPRQASPQAAPQHSTGPAAAQGPLSAGAQPDLQQAPLQQAPSHQPDYGVPHAPAARLGGAHQPADVVPPRPEPFLPKRAVDHPEPHAATARQGFPAPGTPVMPGHSGQPSSAPQGAPTGAGGPPASGLAPSAPGSMSMGGAAAAVQPAGQVAIERDPSVNRSLMLRLIAGVRGL
ncbi:MAG: DUF4388 domain-containing protein [Actinomycetes bacterium]